MALLPLHARYVFNRMTCSNVTLCSWKTNLDYISRPLPNVTLASSPYLFHTPLRLFLATTTLTLLASRERKQSVLFCPFEPIETYENIKVQLHICIQGI